MVWDGLNWSGVIWDGLREYVTVYIGLHWSAVIGMNMCGVNKLTSFSGLLQGCCCFMRRYAASRATLVSSRGCRVYS